MTRSILPPTTINLERSVIGAILLRPHALDELEQLASDHFGDLRCRATWDAIRNLAATGRPIDQLTVESWLEDNGQLDAVGGIAFLAGCLIDCPSENNIGEYAERVRENALHRGVMLALDAVKGRVLDAGLYGRELLGEAMALLARLDCDDVRDETRAISTLTREHVKALELLAERREDGRAQLTGFPSGVPGLDNEIGGWQPGIVSVVCARPGHGKSSLCLATADACSKAGIGVHVFSLEDPRRAYMNRALARVSGVAIDAIATCTFSRDQLNDFGRAHHDLAMSERPWIVDDRSGLTSEDIVRSVRRHRKQNRTRVVVVDYLQLLKRSRRSIASNRHEAIGESLHDLADAAKNDNMAYIVVSQLNRGVESRDDKRPQESDLRESGTIEERAKCILGLYRGARYGSHAIAGIDVDDEGRVMSPERFRSTVQLLVIKNSQGPAPVRVLASWHGPTTRIS